MNLTWHSTTEVKPICRLNDLSTLTGATVFISTFYDR